MSKIEELIDLIKNDPLIIRYKKLEKIIDQDEQLKEDYNQLLTLQKKLVQNEYTNSSTLEIQASYNQHLEKLHSHYLMGEYLELLENINNDLQLITKIIEEEINFEIID